METMLLGLAIGGIFGAALYLSGLADPDKIIGMLRLKDLHALRTMAVFVVVGMGGTWLLQINGLAHGSIKPARLLAVSLGGGLMGFGFGMTGYCPGTGLACAITGRFDAWVAVLGMGLGALGFIAAWPYVVEVLEAVGDFGQATIPGITKTDPVWWVASIVGAVTLALWIGHPRKKKADAEAPDAA